MRVPLRLVLDTNVVLELFHFNDPATRGISALIEAGDALCYACPRTLAEIEVVAPRPEFRLDEAAAAALVAHYRARALIAADPTENPLLPRCRDTSDQKFIELAVSVGADFLLTRDKAVLKLARRLARQSPCRVITPDKLPDPATLALTPLKP